ncbi:MAG TPA: His-Xaa-Ser system radical SAM maturase HxsC [Candidatus Tumulicola sp.]
MTTALKLGGSNIELVGFDETREPFIILLSSAAQLPQALRSQRAYLLRSEPIPPVFALYVVLDRDRALLKRIPAESRAVVIPDDYDYLADGDIVRINSNRHSIRVLYRKQSRHNAILVTERCNHYCLMCSQPPRDIDDSWIVPETLAAIPLMDRETESLTITGGEPTLLGEDLLRILRASKNWLPSTSMHILSNGRRFADERFARQYAGVAHPDLMVGIPIYSDLSTIHDYVVQSDGAFDETLRGILNLKRYGQRVEVRVVLHKQTYERLPQLAEFIARNLLFVDHVALMGLEMTGFTKANLNELWIDPYDYQPQLRAAVHLLDAYQMNVSIYNHQLCVLDPLLWRFARKSISDWKNEYMPECEACVKQTECGGFFSSAKVRYSEHIQPFIK